MVLALPAFLNCAGGLGIGIVLAGFVLAGLAGAVGAVLVLAGLVAYGWGGGGVNASDGSVSIWVGRKPIVRHLGFGRQLPPLP
jgi:hypothetical protein